MTVTIITTVISKIMQVGQNCFMSWMKHFNFHKVWKDKTSPDNQTTYSPPLFRPTQCLSLIFWDLMVLIWIWHRFWNHLPYLVEYLSELPGHPEFKEVKIEDFGNKTSYLPLKLTLNAMSWCLEAQCPQHYSCILPSTHFPTDASAQRLRLCPFPVHFGLNFSKNVRSLTPHSHLAGPGLSFGKRQNKDNWIINSNNHYSLVDWRIYQRPFNNGLCIKLRSSPVRLPSKFSNYVHQVQ